ncbi:MAG: DHHA1 domain-containing protein, partial [Bacillota bacterium]
KIAENVAVLIQSNKERKRIQEEAFQKCREVIAAELQEDLFYIISPKDIHEGIAGIVAGKIKDEFGRPAIIVSASGGDGYLKGTGRSINGLNLYDLLKKNEKLFLKFGGHSGACGFLMKADDLEALRISLNQEVQLLYHENQNLFDSSLLIDLEIEEGDINLDLAWELEKLAPFGCQNERPLFQIKGIKPTSVNFMGASKQHVRFSGLGSSGNGVACIMFQKAQDYSEMILKASSLNLAGYPDINVWNGDAKIQFVLKCISC